MAAQTRYRQDPADAALPRQHYQSSRSQSSNNMREALQDVVTIRPVDPPLPKRSETNGSLVDSYGATSDILSAYDEPAPPPPPKQQREPTRSSSNPKGKSPQAARHGDKKATAPKKPDVPFDVIDRLDISGLYGGGAFHRHDGPYAAATASRNKGPQAPMAAFDPSALAPPAPTRAPRGSSNLSARAAATLAAMDSEEMGMRDGPYGAVSQAGPGRPRLGRRASDSSITMGFPTGSKGKGQQLIEMYGVRDNEAWEDFGTSKYTGDTGSFASSRESILPPGVSKADRADRAQSIWDIEATLKAGKPVGQAPPPIPILPTDFSNNSLSPGDKPKRSKSLVQRFRSGRRNPNNPMDSNNSDGSAPSSPMHELTNEAAVNVVRDDSGRFNVPTPPRRPQGDEFLPTVSTGVRFNEGEATTSPTGRSNARHGAGPPPAGSAKFGGGEPLQGSRSAGEAQPKSNAPQRRPSVMQRLFSSGKTK